MSPLPRMKPIVSWWQLAGLLVVCGAGIYYLLPDDPRLLEDLVRDGKTKEARRFLAAIPPAERAAEAPRYLTAEIKLARRELPPGDPAAVQAFWLNAVAAWRKTGYSEELFLEFAPLVPQLPQLAEAWARLATDVAPIPPAQRSRLEGDFVRAALGAGQPATAAAIYASVHPTNARTTEEAVELSRLWRLSDRPADALAALGDRAEPAVVAQRIVLLRHLNRNREALALLRAQADARPNQTPDEPLARELASVAAAAGAAVEAAPYLQRHLATNPGDVTLTRQLRDLFLSAGQPAAAVPAARSALVAGSRDPADVRALAQVLEFSGEPAAAFDLWLELALAGDLAALERLVALNPGLYRDADLARVLEARVPVPGHDDYTLNLARLQVLLGRYDKAQNYFERFLKVAPNDVTAVTELARLHFELYHFVEAEAGFRRASVLRPDDISLQIERANCLVLLFRHDEALAIFAELAANSTDENVLGPYARLAESLGRYEDFSRALKRRLATTPNPAGRDYLMLAYAFELADDAVQQRAALEEGLSRVPGDDAVRLQLAVALAEEKKFARAATVLAVHGGLHDHAPAATLYLDLLRLSNDVAGERRYLQEPLAPVIADDEAVLERIARARESVGELAEAERIWRELLRLRPAELDRMSNVVRLVLRRGATAEADRILEPYLAAPTAATWQAAAQVASAAGDHRRAENYQQAFLDATPEATAADWGALGDIRLSRGDREGAKRAYAEALRRLHRRIAQGGPS